VTAVPPTSPFAPAQRSSGSPAPHERARPLARGSVYPAKDLCSHCGLCDSRWVAYVRQACAFLNQRFEAMEIEAHGRPRDLDNEDELYFGVHQRMLTARLRQPLAGAQWTGIVSTIGVRALESGLVDAVLCVGQSPDDRFTPVPTLARTPEQVLAARVNKPTLSPNLEVLEQLPGSGIRRLLAIGVGCQIQALRAVQETLPLDELYVLGLPCVDNVSREGLQTFLESASSSPATVVHYEFMQDFRIHFRHEDGHEETVPFFGLDTPKLKDVFAPSCLSCFDYTNAGADLVVGYMGAEFGRQWITVRNERGAELLALVEAELDAAPVMSRGDRHQAVQQGIDAYDRALRLPRWLAELVGLVVQRVGPKGLEYGRFSIDSHFTRNALWLRRHHGAMVERHLPEFARRIVSRYRLPAL
jgi:coenzyme F420-reducing hydrogenase beta subunit